jgi:hypothetical protein
LRHLDGRAEELIILACDGKRSATPLFNPSAWDTPKAVSSLRFATALHNKGVAIAIPPTGAFL